MAKIQEKVWETLLEYTIVFKLTYGLKSVWKKILVIYTFLSLYDTNLPMVQNQFEKNSCHIHFLSLYDTNWICHAEHLRISVWVSLLVYRKLLSVDLGLFIWTEEETAFRINTCIISWEE